MCTGIAQVIFTVVLVGGFGLTIVAFVTPGWNKLYWEGNSNASIPDSIKNKDYSFGLITNLCGDKDKGEDKDFAKRCLDDFKDKELWEKVVIACMGLAILAEFVAILWTCMLCCACCCKSCLAPPLPILTALSSLFILIAVIVFAAKKNAFDDLIKPPDSFKDLKSKNELGYSIWLAIVAFVVMVVDTIIGAILCKTASVSPM